MFFEKETGKKKTWFIKKINMDENLCIKIKKEKRLQIDVIKTRK